MLRKKTVTLSSFLAYLCYFLCIFSLRFIGKNGEPFALSLFFAACFAEFSPIWCGVLYILCSIADFALLPIYAAQAVLLSVAFFIRAKTDKKRIVFPFIGLFLSLALFVLFAPFQAYALPSALVSLSEPILQKVIFAAVSFLAAAVFSVAVRALAYKLLKCRLKTEELLFSVLLFVAVGVGICRAASPTVYMGIAFFCLFLFSCAAKDATALVCAFVLSVPPFLCIGLSPERFFVYGLAVCLSVRSGRFAAVLSVLAVFFAYGYFDGLFALQSAQLAKEMLSMLLPSLLFLALPPALVRKMENKLVFYREKHLSRIAINRNRAAIGEKLFEISGVFREIQSTFTSLSGNEADEGAKEYIVGYLAETVCKNCTQYKSCQRKNFRQGLQKLVEVGAAKGRASLIDVPKELADICTDQSGVLYAANKQLTEYRRYTLEAENAKEGRNLLAGQAQGVSEILKNLALEQSAPLRIRTDKEKLLDVALLKTGVVCSEMLLTGEDDEPALSLVTFGKADVKKIAVVASGVLGIPLIISERLTIGKDKYCCILRRKPKYDAAFGVATRTKSGESASGDTHSVIKIDERRFMLALSDGMGSGEYARKISESTVSLLESFYRAKMPSPLVLSTINKLLTFSKEETFACVDIAVVDLDTGVADVVKIGSPMGFILSENIVRILDSASLPLGILESLHPDTSSYALKENDVLLFLSDGITAAFPSSSDLYETLKKMPAANPQRLAESILDQALKEYGGVAKDDMTVLAVRLFESVV